MTNIVQITLVKEHYTILTWSIQLIYDDNIYKRMENILWKRFWRHVAMAFKTESIRFLLVPRIHGECVKNLFVH